MGTNYYYTTNLLELDPIHIGKSSYGWAFALHIYPDIRTLNDWIEKWKTGQIYDEYGREIAHEAMMSLILNRQPNHNIRTGHNVDMYGSFEKFLEQNYAIYKDEENFLRVNDKYCVGHGDTWDLVERDFS